VARRWDCRHHALLPPDDDESGHDHKRTRLSGYEQLIKEINEEAEVDSMAKNLLAAVSSATDDSVSTAPTKGKAQVKATELPARETSRRKPHRYHTGPVRNILNNHYEKCKMCRFGGSSRSMCWKRGEIISADHAGRV